jgi:hypothetical protein
LHQQDDLMKQHSGKSKFQQKLFKTVFSLFAVFTFQPEFFDFHQITIPSNIQPVLGFVFA